jgi:hypothetical protein
VATASRNVYIAMARKAAEKYGIDPDIFVRQIDQESGFADDVITGARKSSAGAVGIAQFMPATARSMGVDPLNPEDALDGAARYMRQGLERYGGDYRKALAAYNAGFGNVDKYGDVPPFEETQTYVSKILGGRSSGGSFGGQQAAPKKSLLERFNEYRANNKARGNRPSTAEIKQLGDSGQLPLVGAGGGRLALTGGKTVSQIVGGVQSVPGRLTAPAATVQRIAREGAGSVGGAAQAAGGAVASAAGRLPNPLNLRKMFTGGAAVVGGAEALQHFRSSGNEDSPVSGSSTYVDAGDSWGGRGSIGGTPEPDPYNYMIELIARRYSASPDEVRELLEAADGDFLSVKDFLEDDPTTKQLADRALDRGEDARQFDTEFGENRRQFDLEFGENVRQYDQSYEENKRQFDADWMLQNGRLGLDSAKYQTDLVQWQREYDEGVRQFDTQEGRLNRSLDLETELGRGSLDVNKQRLGLDAELGRGRLGLDTELGRGQLALGGRAQNLDESRYISDVLRNPSDFISRAFLSRGQASPQATVSQADLINNLKAGIQQFANGGFTQEGKFITGDSKSGKPTGNEEMIVNPTNAPIMVIPNDQMQGEMGRLPRYALGSVGVSDPYGGNWAEKLSAGQWGKPQDPNFGFDEPAPRSSQMLGSWDSPGNPYHKDYWQQGGHSQINGAGMLTDWQRPDEDQIQWLSLRGSQFDQSGGRYRPGAGAAAHAAMQQWNDTQGFRYLKKPSGQAPQQVSQQDLINTGKANLAPGAAAALYGGRIPNARPVGQLTPGKLGRLTPGELQALNSQLGVEFNTNLETEMGLLQQRFGPVVNRARGRLG